MSDKKTDEYDLQIFEKNTINLDNIVKKISSVKYYQTDKLLLLTIIFTFATVEYYYKEPKIPIAKNEPKLKKHRQSRVFDYAIQDVLNSFGRIGTFDCTVKKCASNGLHRTELQCKQRKNVWFVMYSVDENTKYLQPYFAKNKDSQNPQFFIFKYDIDKATDKIDELSIEIPSFNGTINDNCRFDLMSYLNEMRLIIKRLSDVDEFVVAFANRLKQINQKKQIEGELEGELEGE